MEFEKECVPVVEVQVGIITLMPLVQRALVMNSQMDCTWTYRKKTAGVSPYVSKPLEKILRLVILGSSKMAQLNLSVLGFSSNATHCVSLMTTGNQPTCSPCQHTLEERITDRSTFLPWRRSRRRGLLSALSSPQEGNCCLLLNLPCTKLSVDFRLSQLGHQFTRYSNLKLSPCVCWLFQPVRE